MDVTAPRVTAAAPSAGTTPAIRLSPETAIPFGPMLRSSMAVMEIAGNIYRIEFWPDKAWKAIPEALRPIAIRAHSDDGWFLISAVADFLASLPPLG